MKIPIILDSVTTDKLQSELQNVFTEYTFLQSKNMFGSYIIVAKSPYVGAAVQIRKDKITVYGMNPALWVRALLGGLLLIAFTYTGMKKVEKNIGEYIQTKYGHKI